jgi:hypothetical protein
VIVDQALVVVYGVAAGCDHEGNEWQGVQQKMEPRLVFSKPFVDRREFLIVHQHPVFMARGVRRKPPEAHEERFWREMQTVGR